MDPAHRRSGAADPSPPAAGVDDGPGSTADELAASLAGVWRTVLELDEIDDDANFFELGGHSMLAALLISHCERTIGTVIPLQLVFDNPVFGDFVAAVARYDDQQGPALPRLVAQGLRRAPLSLQQEQYLQLEQALALPSVNNMVAVVEVGADLTLDALQAGVDALVRRHPALRTAVRPDGDTAVQIVLPADGLPPVPCTEIDLGALSPERRAATLRSRVMRQFLVPFDLAEGVLLRCQVFRNGADPDVLVLHLHHSACDGNCIGFVLDDLAASCVGRPIADAAADDPEHLDYCRWQRDNLRELLDDSRAHWRTVVRALAEDLVEPVERRATASYVRLTTHLPVTETQQLRTWTAAAGLTEFSTVAAAAALAVGRVGDRSRAGIGMMLDNRNHAGLERTVGSFALSSLMAVDLTGVEVARDLVARVQDEHLAARRRTQLPLETLLAEPADELGVTPNDLIDLVVDFERIYRMNRPGRLPLSVGVDLSELLRMPLLGPRRTLTAVVQDDERLALTIECVDEPAERAEAQALLDATVQALADFAKGPDVPIGTGR
ncbi:condensation domain-containing protein [Micromonospora pallida]|uniref:condensation domain-containing protein n=1 Tax=Micromonospora pallida TaxID=145854 RepID=UPI00159EFFAD|nr:condensation domain-containing protein [Micromonospora pallida]